MSDVLNQILSELNAKEPDAEMLLDLRNKLFSGTTRMSEIRAKVSEWTGSRETQGMYLYLVGDYERALRTLEQEAASETATLFHGLAAVEMNQPERALTALEDHESLIANIARARSNLLLNNIEDAEQQIADLIVSDGDRTDVKLLRAEYQWRTGDIEQAVGGINAVLEAQPQHRGALFLGALLADRIGEETVALKRYEALVQIHPIHVDALINLGVMYEDLSEYRHALRCYDAVLAEHPHHTRAKLFRKDAEASIDMYYDEDKERKEDKRLQVLRTPVTDFELSVRSRNCLAKMKIDTLGDLIQKTEAELLAYKNFGETSLQEIKSILGSKGLRLGMGREEALKAATIDDSGEGGSEKHDGVLAESIDTLELSVRARRCMERLNVQTIGTLVNYTEQQLLTAPNFGTTSLIEVKRKLAELGLSLNQG